MEPPATDIEAPVILRLTCACGAEYPWRCGREAPEVQCPTCRAADATGRPDDAR